MTNHQFTTGQLVDYLQSDTDERLLATVLEQVDEGRYQIQIRGTKEEQTVQENKLESLEG